MNETVGSLRLKDRIIIAVIMSIFALLLAGGAGAVAIATADSPGYVDRHAHTYVRHLEKTPEGDFRLVGVCQNPRCTDPNESWPIISGVSKKVTKKATCHSAGEKVYTFIYQFEGEEVKTYTLKEVVEPIPHNYVGTPASDSEDGKYNITCNIEGCKAPAFSSDDITDVVYKSSDPATCTAGRKDYYSFTMNGQSYTFVTYVAVEAGEHVLNGKVVSEYEIAPGVFKYGTEGVFVVDNIPLVSCGQKTAAYYICHECNKTVGAVVGTAPHTVNFTADCLTKLPTFEQSGEAMIPCENEGCDHQTKVSLPKAVEGENTVSVSVDEENKIQTWKYSYDFEGVAIEFEFTTEWEHDHVFEYDPSKTQAPTIYRDGSFIVKCTLCDKEKMHSLPKINEGVNAVLLNEATEAKGKTYKYTYVSDTYGFTEELEIAVSDPLSHAYKYELIFYGDGFAMSGTCSQPECKEPEIITDIGLTPEHKYVSPTCSAPGYESWSYTKDGQTSTIRFDLPPDNSYHAFVPVESKTVYPTFEANGSTVLKCSGATCGVETAKITLPKLGEDVSVNPDNRVVTYIFTYMHGGKEYVGILEYPLSEEHTHFYSYELIPMEGTIGKFDLVGICGYPLCGDSVVENDVPATLVQDNSTCTGGIKQIWSYDKNGKTYLCNLDIVIPDGHKMAFDPDAPTTIKPTLTETGSLEIFCTKNNCDETIKVELPVIVEGVNATRIETEFEIAYEYEYEYVYNPNAFDGDGTVIIRLIILFTK